MGYSAGSSDCIMSFSRWQKLIAARIEKVVRPAVCAGLRVAVAWLKKGLLQEALQCAGFGAKNLSLEGVGGAELAGFERESPGFERRGAHPGAPRTADYIFIRKALRTAARTAARWCAAGSAR